MKTGTKERGERARGTRTRSRTSFLQRLSHLLTQMAMVGLIGAVPSIHAQYVAGTGPLFRALP